MSVVWLIFQVLLVVNGLQGEEDEWIDPTDMVNYDAASGRMRRPHLTRDEQDVAETHKDTAGINQDQSSGPDYTVCERHLGTLWKFEESKKVQPAEASGISCNPVFKRYLNKLLLETEKLGLPDTDNEVHYDAEVYLTKHDVTEIKKFLDGKPWKSGPLDDALSRLLVNFKYHDPEVWKWKFEDVFGVDLFTILQFLACLVCILLIFHLAWRTLTRPFRFILFCFLLSFGWNWVFLYKTAFAKRQANFAKMEHDTLICTGVQKLDWTGSLAEWFRRTWTLQDDKCEKYYEALLVHPVWEVPPARAVMLTITTLVTEPLKHVGQPISQLFRDILKDLPWVLQVPVTLMVVLSIIAFWYSCGQSVARYGLPRFYPDDGSRSAIAQQRAPCLMQNPMNGTVCQRAVSVDYQAGGDARYLPNISRESNHDESTFTGTNGQNNMNHQGVEEIMNREGAGGSDNGRGDNHLRRRRVPGGRSAHTYEDPRTSCDIVLSTEPPALADNLKPAARNITGHNIAPRAGLEVEDGDQAGFPHSDYSRLCGEKRTEEKNMPASGRALEDSWTAERSLHVGPQHPSDKSHTYTEPIDKKTLEEEKHENEEEAFIENVGAQAFNNLESGQNQGT
ncbi:chloride channel CLIC-like protein 1 isoform X2 [Rhinoraja longicauda]